MVADCLGIVTSIFLILLFYPGALTRREDDQLFLGETASSRATEQSQLIAKVNKINPLLKGTKVGTNGRPFFSQIRGKLHQINESLIGS